MTTELKAPKPRNVRRRVIPQEATPVIVPTETAQRVPVNTLIWSLVLGVYFGVVLTKSEVASWQRVNDMFLFKEPHMFLIIGTGIGVAMVSMFLIKRCGGKSINGKTIQYQPKPWHQGVMFGGMLFGAGWALTGACPGPIYAQIGGGAWMAMFTLAGAICGTFIFAVLRQRLPQ